MSRTGNSEIPVELTYMIFGDTRFDYLGYIAAAQRYVICAK